MIVRRKIVGGLLAAVAASGLVFATGTPAAAHVAPHKHCLLTPDGWVPIAEGVSESAPNLALEKFHVYVHTGVPGSGGEPLTIARIGVDQDCSTLPVPSAV
jgi:hypothetical protein